MEKKVVYNEKIKEENTKYMLNCEDTTETEEVEIEELAIDGLCGVY